MTDDAHHEAGSTRGIAWAIALAWAVSAVLAWARPVQGFEARVIVVVLLGVKAITSAGSALWPAVWKGPHAAARRVALACWVASWPGGPWWAVAAVAAVVGALEAHGARWGERVLGALALGGALAVGWNAWRFGPPPLRVFFTATCVVLAAAARGVGKREKPISPSTDEAVRAPS
ncbi:MAG: hypothetical protein WCJ30_14205 [Deltaproteobacteria bacterium]